MPYRTPFDWPAMLAFFAMRAIDGVEVVADGVYARTVSAGGHFGVVAVRDDPARAALAVDLWLPDASVEAAILGRVAFIFDVETDVVPITAHLARDATLARLVARRPGLRPPGGWDGFELGVRAILGQQVTVVAARRLAGDLVRICGTALPIADARAGLTHAFPSAAHVAAAELGALGMPGARRATLVAFAQAADRDPSLFRRGDTLDEAIARLRDVRGIGEWTAHYIALRGLRDADAFPASDIGLLRAAADATGMRPSPAALLRRAEAWRPWRAYAAQHLWTSEPPSP